MAQMKDVVDLPVEVLAHVFSFLNGSKVEIVSTLRSVSRYFRHASLQVPTWDGKWEICFPRGCCVIGTPKLIDGYQGWLAIHHSKDWSSLTNEALAHLCNFMAYVTGEGFHFVEFNLSGNQFSDLEITDFSPLRLCAELRTLDLSSSLITDAQLSRDLQCSELMELHVNHCKGVRSLECLTNFPMLKKLSCIHTRLHSLTRISALRSLEELDITGCSDITGKEMDSSFETPGILKIVRCGHTNFSDAALSNLCKNHPTLQRLDVSDCWAITTFPDVPLRCLKEVSCAHCNIGDSSLRSMAKCPQLRRLDLRECQKIADLTPLESCSLLEELVLDYCDMKDAHMIAVAKFPALTALSIVGCVALSSLEPLKDCATLRDVDCRKCPMLCAHTANVSLPFNLHTT